MSQLHLAAGRAITNGRGKVALEPHVFERESLEERSVSVAEARPPRTQPLERLAGQNDRHRTTAPSELDHFARFRLDEDGGKMSPSFCDGVTMRHADNVHDHVHPCDRRWWTHARSSADRARALAALPLIAVMLVAIASTKVPIFLGHGYWMFAGPFVSKHGLWSLLHEARTDLAMLLGSLFVEVCAAFLKLGSTSFGGPIAHLSYIRAECVEKRGWLGDDDYADTPMVACGDAGSGVAKSAHCNISARRRRVR